MMVIPHQPHSLARICSRLPTLSSRPFPLLLCLQVDVELVKGPKNRYGSAFQQHATDLTREKAAERLVDPLKARSWTIRNPNVTHAVTGMTSLALVLSILYVLVGTQNVMHVTLPYPSLTARLICL